MGGEGSMLAMIQSIRYNQEQRRKKRSLKDITAMPSGHSPLKFEKEMSPDELERFRQNLRLERKKRDRVFYLFLFIILLCSAGLIALFFII